jgi:restriction system protein
MPIPDYQEFMLPVLELLADGQDHRLRDLTKAVADRFKLTDAERAEMLPSGQQTVISNRVAWAKTYLKKAGLLANPVRGMARITDEGKKVLTQRPGKIDNEFLRKYPSFAEFYKKNKPVETKDDHPEPAATPEESLESAYGILHDALADELLDKVESCSPAFFEHLVVDLLVAMGYGGSLADAGQAIGKSGDGGIDGIIKEDKLGLDVVCIQAKRWEKTVGRPEVQAFAGSMEGMRAKKGVLITTASFSKEAEEYVNRIERKIVLIDGQSLAELMIEHDIGVATARSYVVKKVDFDYFEGEEG